MKKKKKCSQQPLYQFTTYLRNCLKSLEPMNSKYTEYDEINANNQRNVSKLDGNVLYKCYVVSHRTERAQNPHGGSQRDTIIIDKYRHDSCHFDGV